MKQTLLTLLLFGMTYPCVSFADDLECSKIDAPYCIQLYNFQEASNEIFSNIFYVNQVKYYFEANPESAYYAGSFRVAIGTRRIYLKSLTGGSDFTIGYLPEPMKATDSAAPFTLAKGVSFQHRTFQTVEKTCNSESEFGAVWEIYQIDSNEMTFKKGHETVTLLSYGKATLLNRFPAPTGCQ